MIRLSCSCSRRSIRVIAAVKSLVAIAGKALFTATATSDTRQPSMIRSATWSPGAFWNSTERSRGLRAGETL